MCQCTMCPAQAGECAWVDGNACPLSEQVPDPDVEAAVASTAQQAPAAEKQPLLPKQDAPAAQRQADDAAVPSGRQQQQPPAEGARSSQQARGAVSLDEIHMVSIVM